MSRRRTPTISTRKEPQQARSNDLMAAVLKAAVQVLAKEGGQRFTMARVAAKAGVSVGSLYQYFPNKAAVLFRLQSDEWRQTAELLGSVLANGKRTPLERLRALVHAFMQSECDEAAVRVALNDVAPLYRDAPEAQEARAAGQAAVEQFMCDALPQAPDSVRIQAADLVTATLSALGKQFSESPRTQPQIVAYSDAVADMLCAYLQSLDETRAPPSKGKAALGRQRR